MNQLAKYTLVHDLTLVRIVEGITLLTSRLKFLQLSCQVINPHCTSQDEIDFDWPSWKQKSLLERVQDPGLSIEVGSFCWLCTSCHVQGFHWSMQLG